MSEPFDRDHVVSQIRLLEMGLSSQEGTAALAMAVEMIDVLERTSLVFQELGMTRDRVRLSKGALAIAAEAMVASFPQEENCVATGPVGPPGT